MFSLDEWPNLFLAVSPIQIFCSDLEYLRAVFTGYPTWPIMIPYENSLCSIRLSKYFSIEVSANTDRTIFTVAVIYDLWRNSIATLFSEENARSPNKSSVFMMFLHWHDSNQCWHTIKSQILEAFLLSDRWLLWRPKEPRWMSRVSILEFCSLFTTTTFISSCFLWVPLVSFYRKYETDDVGKLRIWIRSKCLDDTDCITVSVLTALHSRNRQNKAESKST